VIDAQDRAGAHGTLSTVDIPGNVIVSNITWLTLQGTINDNARTLALNSAGNITQLILNDDNPTSQGGGRVTLTDNSQNYILGTAASATLTNVDNTISCRPARESRADTGQ
jgi:hypothetical protein